MATIGTSRNLYFVDAFAIILFIDLEKTMTFANESMMALIGNISIVYKVRLHYHHS
jgi:hypothetical protein